MMATGSIDSVHKEESTKWSTVFSKLEETLPVTLKDLEAYIETRKYLYFDDVSGSIQNLRDKINRYFDIIEQDFQLVENDEENSLLPFQLNEFDVKYINVGIGNCSKHSPVSGCTISPDGRIFLSDYDGIGKLLVYDKTGKFLRFMPVSDRPCGVTVIDKNRIGVTYGNKCYFEIINYNTDDVEKKVSLENALLVLGIACCNDRIYVLAGHEGIVVTDLLGNIVNKIQLPKLGSFHRWIAATSDRIYITDTHRYELHCLDLEGNPIWMHKHEVGGGYMSGGITTDRNGNLLVVDGVEKKILSVDRDGKTEKTVLDIHRHDSPSAIHFSKECNVICLGLCSGMVAIYKLV